MKQVDPGCIRVGKKVIYHGEEVIINRFERDGGVEIRRNGDLKWVGVWELFEP